MRIGIFTQWYEPEPGPAALMSVLARELVRRGHEVHVLTGVPNYPTGRIAAGYRQRVYQREELDGVHVHRVPLYPSHDRSAARRILNYLSFGASAAVLGVARLPRLDAVWVNFSPITLSFPLRWQQLRASTPTVCEVADLWPDTLLVAGLRGSGTLARSATRVLHRWCRGVYRSSDAVVHISPGIGEVLRSRGVDPGRLEYIPKPASEIVPSGQFKDIRGEFGIPEDSIVLLYAGALGEAQRLDSLLEATASRSDLPLVVMIAGSGTHDGLLRRQAEQLADPRIRFLGRVDPSDMPSLYAAADVCYLSLASHDLSRITMPSKTQAILAAGKPLLCVAEGDVAELVADRHVGFVADPARVESIADTLDAVCAGGRNKLAEMGEHARKVYRDEFSVQRLGDQAEQLLHRVSGARRSFWRRLRPQPLISPYILAPNEVKHVARLHQRAFPEFFLSSLGTPFLAEFYRGFGADRTAVVAVERDEAGVPVGVAVGTTQPARFFKRLLSKRLFGFAIASLRAVIRDPRAIPRLLSAIRYRGDGPDELEGALLSSISVDPSAQGAGVGRRLLDAWCRRAQSLGAPRAYLTTDAVENDRTNDFYLAAGWTLHDSFTTPRGRSMNRYVREFEVVRSVGSGVATA